MNLLTKYLIIIGSIIVLGILLLICGYYFHRRKLNIQLQKYLYLKEQNKIPQKQHFVFHTFTTSLIMIISIALIAVNMVFLTSNSSSSFDLPSTLNSDDKYLPKVMEVSNESYQKKAWEFSLASFYTNLFAEINSNLPISLNQNQIKYKLNLSYQNQIALTIDDFGNIVDLRIPNIEIYYNGYYCGYEFYVLESKFLLIKTHFLNSLFYLTDFSIYYNDFTIKFQDHNYQSGTFIYHFQEVSV